MGFNLSYLDSRNSRSYGENCLTEEQIMKKISWDVKAIMGHSALAAQATILHKVLRTNWGFLKLTLDCLLSLVCQCHCILGEVNCSGCN